MNVLEIKQQVGDLTGFDYTDSDVAARLLRFINDVRREVYRENQWDFTFQRYQLNLEPDYTTGTISVSQDTRTVTGTGTTFTSDMEGRYIHLNHESNSQSEWYKITSVTSSTELIIDAKYIEADLSDVDYAIREVYHRVPGSVQKIEHLRQFVTPRLLEKIGGTRMFETYSNLGMTTSPYRYMVAGSYGKETTYATGTVSGSGKTVTGSGTSFLGNAVPGDRLTASSVDYYIKSVNSDTSLELFAKIPNSFSGATYTITSDPDSQMIRFDFQNDSRVVIELDYYEKCYPLMGDTDEDFITRNYPELVIEGVLVWEKRATDDQTWTVDYQKWQSTIRNATQADADNYIWAPKMSKFGKRYYYYGTNQR